MTDDTRQPNDPDRNDAEREQSAEDAPTPLVEDGDAVIGNTTEGTEQ